MASLKVLRYLIILSALASCAQMVAPSGGPKDVKPPNIAESKPPNKTINFNASQIKIKFDEYIQLKDPEQIVISPILPNKPLIEADGKTVEIRFLKSKPAPNTTYTINFGNSIVDNNEGIAIDNFSYTFSTGKFLDSNSVSGSVQNAFNNNTEKGIIAGLYPASFFTDTTLLKTYPVYFSKSNEKGKFTIDNLPADTFFLFAFKDQNADIRYTKNEPISFIKEPVIAGTDGLKQNLYLFSPPEYFSNKLLDTLTRQRGKFQFVFYRPRGVVVYPTIKQKFYFQPIKGKDFRDTFNIYIPFVSDSIPVDFTISTPDTLYTLKIQNKTKSRAPDFGLQILPVKNLSDSIRVISTTPIDSFDIKKIKLLEDTVPVKPIYTKEYSKTEWLLFYPLKENRSYTVIIPDSQFTNIYKKFNTATKLRIGEMSLKDYGNLIVSIKAISNQNILLQIVEDNTEENIIRSNTCYKDTEMIFDNLSPSSVKIKIVIDENNNGQWDSGDIASQKLPEKVYYYKQAINIKAYWDIELTIDLPKIINE